ncbi:hypothetical protein B0A48_10822 [Cryoendolithus antarcticus]|uniref:Yeast cell wall synthesis Kre9/Knh1-like N-terminal domain-containing protein n=1 Tax=Cryoendolithus antarcticus TaxID=1507870 RepID=A0A1V8SZ87_9PEZI|nr:hypothetical protein B0A48_10822 [Cryoendolithus antarcticus]
MRFFGTALLALAAPLLVAAQDSGNSSANAFVVPTSGISGTAGQTLNLQWTPTTSGTVSLILRSGASSDLNKGTTIASNIQNSGSYAFNIPSDVTRGSDYTVEIVDDSDSSVYNFTPYFVIESTNTVASSTGALTSGAPTGSVSLSTASATDSATGVTASSTVSGSATSAGTASTGSTTGSASSSGSMSTRASSATSATASGAVLTSSSAAAGARQTAMAGMLGIVALGAMAL